MIEEQAIELHHGDLVITRAPDVVLSEAQKAAKALAEVIKGKKKPVIFNGEQYLEFEDWSILGRFYGITARVAEADQIQIGSVTGFQAWAEAVMVSTGQVISRAKGMCLNDELNWKGKPLFQLMSMAQTRASAKALRNVLAWVVVLAGYKPTPSRRDGWLDCCGAEGKAQGHERAAVCSRFAERCRAGRARSRLG